MSLIRLANGHKYEIEQPNEGEGMMRNRRRNTVQITFRAGAEQFDAIRADIKPENLESFRIYYPPMSRMNSSKASAISCLKPSRWWATGKIKRSNWRKKPARPRPFMAVSSPSHSANGWLAIHDRSAPLGRCLIL